MPLTEAQRAANYRFKKKNPGVPVPYQPDPRVSKEEIENKITQHAQDYHFAAAQDVTGVFYKSE